MLYYNISRMNIKAVIKAHHLTINKVAEALGVNRISFSNTINNNPTYSTLKKIADVVGCDVMDFFKDEATHQPPERKDFLAVVRNNGECRIFESAAALKAYAATL